MRTKKDLLISIYFDPAHPSSFSSVKKLYTAAKARNLNITLRDVQLFLQNIRTYTSFKPVQRNFQRRKIIVRGKNDQWQLDLIVIPKLREYNDGYVNILAVIDCFSRFAYVEPMISKSANETLLAFKRILRRARTKPRLIQTDLGSEFKGIFTQFLRKNGMHQFSTSQDPKCAIVERFIRTFKTRLFKYMKANNTKRYIDVLQTIIYSYNCSKHRTLGLSPIEVNESNEKELWEKQYRDHLFTKKRNSPQYKVGDKVRLTKYKRTFNRSFFSNWKKEIFQVAHILYTKPITYVLLDKQNELLGGGVYAQEMSKVVSRN